MPGVLEKIHRSREQLYALALLLGAQLIEPILGGGLLRVGCRWA
eukprot:COSAG01_NODE_655_length_14476_cov_6.592265_4_plen_44_part_00